MNIVSDWCVPLYAGQDGAVLPLAFSRKRACLRSAREADRQGEGRPWRGRRPAADKDGRLEEELTKTVLPARQTKPLLPGSVRLGREHLCLGIRFSDLPLKRCCRVFGVKDLN